MANKVKIIFANMSWLMVSQIITSICAFIWTILTARYLGPSDYGIFGTAVSFSILFGVFADFGINASIVRTISTDMDNESSYLNNAISLKMFLSVFYLAVVSLALFILGWEHYVVVFCFLYAVENLIKTFQGTIFASFQSHEQMKYQAITNTLLNVLTLIFIILITFTNFGLMGITIAYIVANIIALVYEVYALRKHFLKPKFCFNLDLYKNLIKIGIPFALTGVFYTVYYSIDLVMINHFSTAYAAGLYNSAYKLINVLTLFYSIYTAAIFPVMSKLFKNEKNLLNLSFVNSIKYLSLVTIPIAVFTLFYGYDIIGIYGAEYMEAGNVLKILIWTIAFLFINGACSLILNASHKEYSVTKIYSIAAIFNVGLNLILIPKYSVYGASVATVLSEILIFILEIYMIKKIDQLPNRHLLYDMIKICFASGILGIVLYVLNLNIWIAIIVSIITYFSAILLVKTVDDEDKLILKQIFNK